MPTIRPVRLPVVFLSREERDASFHNPVDGKPDGWKSFYARYLNSSGIITISRVGFNSQGDKAMVYLGSTSGALYGSGRFHIFRKQGGKWVEAGFTRYHAPALEFH